MARRVIPEQALETPNITKTVIRKAGAKSAAKRVGKSSARLVDDQLAKYRSMRDFNMTLEPAGNILAPGSSKSNVDGGDGCIAELPFVIQKHAATRLHYDLRLGWNGVLKSWAVTKGPSYSTKDKRLAVQVEDHPMEYGGFEGIIPKGQYGGGSVMLWDTGTWMPQSGHADVDAGLRDGSLKFTLFGKKLRGNWALIRMRGKSSQVGKEDKQNWLLLKEHDEFERSPMDAAITDESPDSVVTGRSLSEIASSQDHVWNSNEAGGQVNNSGETGGHDSTIISVVDSELSKFPMERSPRFIAPQLAMQASWPPRSAGNSSKSKDRWLHELKLDGYRVQAHKETGGETGSKFRSKPGATVRLFTRSSLDWTHRMPSIVAAIKALPVDSAILDGEVAVLAENGTTSFADLQASFQEGVKHALTYFVFDLLHLNGHNLRGAPLVERKRLLAEIVARANSSADLNASAVRMTDDIRTDGAQVFEQACKLGAEGIVSKRINSKYTSGRTTDWIKIKCIHDQEFVIGGYTLPSNGHHGVGALLLGYYDEAGKLIYAGRTGTGFTQKSHRLIRDRLDRMKSERMPFASMGGAARKGAKWVEPSLVGQVNFATWTADHLIRQASFKGLREDKLAAEVHLEEVVPPIEQGRLTATHKSAVSHRAKAQNAVVGRAVDHPPVRLTHPAKVLDEITQLTKQQLADYYWAVGEVMLPEIANRPLSLVRCPQGSTQACFFQKHTNSMQSKDIETVEVRDKKTGAMEPYITLSTKEALAGLAQMGVLELHPWGSKNKDLEHPDRIVLDLDPDESVDWRTLAASAEHLRELLKTMSLESYLKTTGGKGLHLVIPITPEHDWAVIKQFAHKVALNLEKEQPKVFLSKMSKAARRDRIYVDYLRNERGATAVAVLSPRARPGMPVSMPLKWTDLKSAEHPIYRVADFDDWKGRLARHPWKALPLAGQHLDLGLTGRVLG